MTDVAHGLFFPLCCACGRREGRGLCVTPAAP
jgi:hypothetical protein